MKSNKVYLRLLVATVLFVVFVLSTSSFWASRFYYGLMLYKTHNEPILTVEAKVYQLPKAESISKYINFEGISVPSLTGEEVFSKISTTSVRKIFFDGATSTEVILGGVQYKRMKTPSDVQLLAEKKSINSSEKTNYEVAKSIWSLTDNHLNFWTASHDRMGDMYGLIMKGVTYSRCNNLLEFENQYLVKGLLCATKQGNTTIFLFLPNDTNYELWLLGVPDNIRDTIVSGIRPKDK